MKSKIYLMAILLAIVAFSACSKALAPTGTTLFDVPAFNKYADSVIVWKLLQPDTTYTVYPVTLTDTVFMASEMIEVHDSVWCPGMLVRDSMVYITSIVYVPEKHINYSRTVYDTIRTIQSTPVTLSQIMSKNYSWSERIAWLLLVGFLMIGWLMKRSNTKNDVIIEKQPGDLL